MSSTPIDVIQTPGGLTAWLVQSPEIPMLSVEIAFRAGQAFLPAKHQGLAQLTAMLMDEGAGDMDMQAFQKELETIGASLSAGADRLSFTVNLTTLSDEKDRAFELLNMALTTPRFDEDAINRTRASMLASLQREKENPSAITRKAYRAQVFAGHPYALATEGTEETLPTLTQQDIQTYYQTHITQANMVISVVGDITPDELATLLDNTLTNLPAGTTTNQITQTPAPITPTETVVPFNAPQAAIMFGHRGISRDHPQYYNALVMNYVLGGGGMSSRLFESVRKEEGLAYHVYSYFQPLPHSGTFTAGVQTSNATVQKAMNMMKDEMRRIQTEPVSQEEYEDAISYLTGSFPLRLDSNNKILDHLTVMQQENLGLDYLEQWPQKIRAVTIADIQQAAQDLLNPEKVTTVIVGQPE